MRLAVLALAATAVGATGALASPQACPTATPPTAACTAAAPGVGEAFSGPVLQVIDGQTLCVAEGPLPSQWVKVRLADARPSDTREDLMRVVFARQVQCIAIDSQQGDGVKAACLSDGLSVPALAESPALEARRQGAGLRPSA